MRRSALAASSIVTVVLAGLVLAFHLVSITPEASRTSDLAFSFGVAVFAFVGAAIVWVQPANVIGWLFCAIGLLWVTGDLAGRYSTYAYLEGSGDGALALLGAWYGEWYWFVFLMLTFSLLPQLFPTGRPMNARWALFIRGVCVFTVLLAAVAMLEDELILIGTDAVLDNPIGIPGFPDIEESFLTPFMLLGAVTSVIGGVVAITLRFRRSTGEERLQLKWFTFAALALILQFVIQSFFGGESGHLYPVLDGIALALVPISAAIAIRRYRLYDIDVVINRALVYGTLSAVLAAAYFGIVVLLQQILSPITSQSDISIAGSTLAVAALFRPVRATVQEFIDRRFYRHRYDAQQTLESFSFRLRNDVDLDHLTADLVDVVHEAVQPAHASLWLRAPAEATP